MDESMNAAGFDEAVLDSAWMDEDTADGAQAQADQPETAQQRADQPAAPEAKADPGGQEARADQPGGQPADQPELFTIQYRGQNEQVTREQLIAMAQKGRDYDTVRAERDQLKQYRQEADPALELVKSYAQRNHMSVGDYLDWCRKQELMAGGMSEQDAGQKLAFEKERSALDAQRAELQAQQARQDSLLQQARQAQQARQRDFEAFLRAYPGVDAKSIPKEVWEAVKGGDTLVNAYTMHENRRLAAELAAERQNKANQARAPGSLGGNSSTEQDEIDRIWNEDD